MPRRNLLAPALLTLALTPTLLLSPTANAQVEGQRVPAPAPANQAPVHNIGRWIDDRMFGVVVIDLRDADLGAVLAQVGEAAGRIEAGSGLTKADFTKAKAELLEARAETDKWLAEYKAAGGAEVWVLLSPEPAFVFPTKEGADAAKLKEMIGKLDFAEGGKVLHRAGVLITGSTLRGLPLAEPNPDRVKQLDDAFASISALNDGKPLARAALIPTDAHRLMLAAVLPQIAQQTNVQVAADLNTKLQWAGIGLSTVPNPEVRAIVQTPASVPAQQFAALANGMLALAAKEAPPGAFVETLRELKFIANEDRAELTITSSTAKRMTEGLVLPLLKARASAKRIKAMSMNRQHLTAVITYTTDHDDKLPDKLEDLKEYIGDADLSHPDGTKWIYRRPADTLAKIENPSVVVLIHEEYKTWPSAGLVVGFADGHVEVIETEDRFKELLKNK